MDPWVSCSYYVGPIPGGPYHECRHLIGACKPCDDGTEYDLRETCSIVCGCSVPRGGDTYCTVG